VRILAGVLVAAVSLGGARLAREALGRGEEVPEDPWAPSPSSAPIVVLGYREVMADLLFVRMTGYFGGRQSSAEGVGRLTEAIVALDPKYKLAYDYGANAMTIAARGVDQSTYLRAIAILEKGVTEFPDDYKIPLLASDMYTLDLVTDDPAQRRAWDERGTLLMESAIRRPGAPVSAATYAAFMRTKLGQRDRAISGLREMLLITTDKAARERIIEKLAKLEESDSAEIAGEIYEERKRFDAAWQRDRPSIRSTMYVLLGPRLGGGFDLGDLATGGADLVGSAPVEKLEPLD
jgi:tetratricopeptide (TPR) repeat protein